eukprot:COSAG02_NODE_7622_length_2929_cov_3.445583_2_plen_69_part_00
MSKAAGIENGSVFQYRLNEHCVETPERYRPALELYPRDPPFGKSTDKGVPFSRRSPANEQILSGILAY